MKKIYLFFVLAIAFYSANSQFVVSRTFLASYTKDELDSVLSANQIPPLFIGTAYGVDVYKVVYNTVSYDSTPTIASGLMAVPKNLPCSLPIVSYQHSPESVKENVPSRLAGEEALIILVLASNGYVGLGPDYLGLGDSPVPPAFLHAGSEATAVIDLVRAARESCDTMGIDLNGQILLAGYSQGGHATMAAHKVMQEKLAGEMQVVSSFPMSGPYNMSGVMENEWLVNTNYPVPSMLAYTFVSWNNVYHMYDSLGEALVAPFDSILPLIFDGTHQFWDAENYITGASNSIFKPDTLAAMVADTNHPFRRALRDNDVYNWTPTSPIKMLFCRGDSYVPWTNAFTAIQAMTQNGATAIDTLDIGAYGHFGCSELAILAAKEYLDDTASVNCATAVNEVKNVEIRLVPNPASNEIRVAGMPAGTNTIRIYAADGRLMLEDRTAMPVQNITMLAPGMYMLQLYTAEGKMLAKKFAVNR